MKNETSHKFRKFLAYLNFFRHFLSKYRYILSFLNIMISVKVRRKFINFSQKIFKFERYFIEKREENEIYVFSFHSAKNFDDLLRKFRDLSGAKV